MASITQPSAGEISKATTYPPAAVALVTRLATETQAAVSGAGSDGTAPVHLVDFATAASVTGTYSSTTLVFTVTATGAVSIDGSNAVIGKRYLFKDQGDSTGGIYTCTGAGASSTHPTFARAADWAVSADVQGGMLISVVGGSANAGLTYQVTNSTAFTLDTTTPTFSAPTTATAASTTPANPGTGAVGNGTTFARNNHVHPPESKSWRIDDAAASTATTERLTFSLQAASTISAIKFYPEATVTANDTDYATITFGNSDGAGGARSTIVSATTKITGGVAFPAYTNTSLGSLANAIIPAHGGIAITITKTGAGQQLKGIFVIEFS
jgi:hypothetical protein